MVCRKRFSVKNEASDEPNLFDDIAADQARTKAWAQQTAELGVISNLLALIESRRAGLTAGYARGLHAMKEALREARRGNISGDIWTLTLTLEQGGGDSSGTRVYALNVGDKGVKAECCGSEWTRGEGSDSWTGATFYFSPDKTEEDGDFYAFTAEFRAAICQTEDDHLCLEKNGDPPLTEAEEKEEERSRASNRLRAGIIQQVIRKLRQMKDPSMLLSGEDSGLSCVWDEICVQQQTEEGPAWGAYEATIRAIIEGLLDDHSHNQLTELWLLTERGEDWRQEHPSDHGPAPCKADVVDFIFTTLLGKALDYTNARIRRHCDSRHELD